MDCLLFFNLSHLLLLPLEWAHKKTNADDKNNTKSKLSFYSISFNSSLLDTKSPETFSWTVTWHSFSSGSCFRATLMPQCSNAPNHPPRQNKYLAWEIVKVDSSAVQVRGLTVTWNQIVTIACDCTAPGRAPCEWQDHAPVVTCDCSPRSWLGFLARIISWPLAGKLQYRGRW